MKPSAVLIVDDEKRYAKMLAMRLSFRGLTCKTCYDGASAIRTIEKDFFSVVVLDLRLPDIYGIDVLVEIKKMHPDSAVIILTGHGTEKDHERCKAEGAHAFLHKPMDVDQLAAIIKKVGEFPN